MRKLEVRCSPPVRMSRSTSRMAGEYRWRRMVASVIAEALRRPAATSPAMARAASAISARPP